MFSDSRLVNESLAFYMSTNTFSNPAFDARMGASQSGGRPSHKKHSSASAVVGGGQQRVAPTLASQTGQELNEPALERTSELRDNCKAFCDSCAFAFKSKMFVWELNVKRKLRGIRAFARKHLPWMPLLAKSSRAGHDQHEQRRGAHTHYDHPASARNRLGADKFWRDVEPETRKTLGLKQERILGRLELAMQDKRRQGQSQQAPLFNMNWPELSDRLHFVRPFQSAGQRVSPTCETFSAPPVSRRAKRKDRYGIRCRLGGQAAKESGKRRARWYTRGPRQVADGQPCTGGDKLCVVCYTNEPNIVTLPCKHHEICSDCFIEIIYTAVKRSQFPLKCVLCRQKVEKIRCSMKLILSVLDKNRTQP